MTKKLTSIAMQEHTEVDLNALTPATTTIPDWYRKIPLYQNGEKTLRLIPRSVDMNTTLKACTPFLDGMTMGYVLTLSEDVQIQRGLNNAASIWWRSTSNIVTEHYAEQHVGFAQFSDFDDAVFKWYNSWLLKTPPGYSTMFTHPINRYDLPFITLTGVVDTDQYPLSVQFPFRLKTTFSGTIERGTPMVQVIPFKRDSWETTKEPYDEKRTRRNAKTFFGKLDRAYKNHFWTKKSFK